MRADFIKSIFVKISIFLFISQAVFAENGEDKLDLQQLEKKYWSSKDDDFNVVQNRKYTKEKKHHLSLQGGILINDPFSVGSIYSAQWGYYFSERWGMDLNYSQSNLVHTQFTDKFINSYETFPNFARYKSSLLFSGNYIPFYAKMSFLEKSIIYFDMGLSLGIGILNYEIQKQEGNEILKTPVAAIGFHQQIFFSEHWALKVELLNKFSEQKQEKYLPGNTRDLGSKWIIDTTFHLGLNYWF